MNNEQKSHTEKLPLLSEGQLEYSISGKCTLHLPTQHPFIHKQQPSMYK